MNREQGFRLGFSLLEVMIATAILSASAMVLLSLISLGTRFGSKAESRIIGLTQAQSILDESILRIQAGEELGSYTGVVGSSTKRSYRVSAEPFSSQDQDRLNPSFQPIEPSYQTIEPESAPGLGRMNTNSNAPKPSQLMLVTVELYESEAGAGPSANRNIGINRGADLRKGADGRTGGEAWIRLVRLVRCPPRDPEESLR